MDISNGSQGEDDDDVVPHKPAPKLTQSPKSNDHPCAMKSNMSMKIPEKTECFTFDQMAVDVAVSETVLQYLDRYKIHQDQLSDDQLRSCIKYVIADAPYHLNLRFQSVESQMPIENCHSL